MYMNQLRLHMYTIQTETGPHFHIADYVLLSEHPRFELLHAFTLEKISNPIIVQQIFYSHGQFS